MREQLTTTGQMPFVSHQNDVDDLELQYESTFTDMSYQAFNTRFPQQAPFVTTFQVIVSDIEEGSAVGAFVLDISGDIYHVPVVMAENKIKPMDMVYAKEMDKFFPFTPEWLEVIQSTSLGEEGEAVGYKDLGVQVPSDVTQMLQPPHQAYRGGLNLSPTGMNRMPGMNVVAGEDGEDYKDLPDFPEILKVASEETKEKFVKLLEGNENIFKFAVQNFDMDKVAEAIHTPMEKTAADDVENDELRILDIDTPKEQLQEVFSGNPVKAMEEIATRGFTAKDTRKKLNEVYDIENPIAFEEIEKSGFYKICKRDGSVETALVVTDLIPKIGPWNDYDDYGPIGHECMGRKSAKKRKDKLAIFSNGSFFRVKDPMCANPCIPTGDEQGMFDKLLKVKTPSKKDPIFFIKACKDTYLATEPFYVGKVVMNSSNSTSYKELDPYYYEKNRYQDKALYSDRIGKKNSNHETQVVVLPSLPTAAKPFYSEDRNTLYLEKGFLPVVLGETLDEGDFLIDAASILQYMKTKAYAASAKDLKISSRGGNDYSVDGKPSGTIKEACEKVANDFHVPFETVYEKVAELKNRGDFTKLLVVPFEKSASIFMGTPGTQVSPEMVQEEAMQQQEMPMQQMPMDPAMMQQQSYMDPSLMQAGAGMQNPEMYNLGAVQSIVEDPKVMEMMQEYTPALEKAMDNSARLLLTLWTEGGQHEEDLGPIRFKELEDSARNAFKELGKLLLLVVRHPGEVV